MYSGKRSRLKDFPDLNHDVLGPTLEADTVLDPLYKLAIMTIVWCLWYIISTIFIIKNEGEWDFD